MNPADKKILQDALALLRSLDAVAAGKIDKKLEDCVQDDRDRQDIVDRMKKADPLAYFWQGGWKELARAWVLAKLAAQHIAGIAYDPPGDGIFNGYLDEIKTLSYDALKQNLTSLTSGKAILDKIMTAKDHSSRDLWDVGAFTNPARHDPKKFRYIIHAMTPAVGFGSKKKRDYMKEKGREQFLTENELKVAEYYLTQTNIIKSEVLCCSIIDQDKTTTFRGSTFGFVLKVPKQNLVAAFDSDAASASKIARARADALIEIPKPVNQLVEIDKFLEDLGGLYDGKLKSPDEVLAASKHTQGHNELVVLGSLLKSSVEVWAIFVKVSESNKLLKGFITIDEKWEISKSIHDCAGRLKVPIVNIPEKSGEASEVDFSDWLAGGGKKKVAIVASQV
jgi:hypothetical protein